MEKEDAFRQAEQKIQEGFQSGFRELNLASMGLAELPESLHRLTQLERLDLSYNQLTALPDWVGRLRNLRQLRIRRNQLTAIPAEIGHIPDLELLWIGHNNLDTLPREMAELTGLRKLDLDHNNLGCVPFDLSSLTHLDFLDLDATGLQSVPPEIERLTQLSVLRLRSNKLTSLPLGLGRLSHLRELEIEGNPLPSEILRLRQTGGLIRYLRDLAEASRLGRGRSGLAPFREAKLLLVGPGEVGKSWLLQALQGKIPDRVGSTKGLEIARQPLDLPHPTDETVIHLNCWDFGGQENYQIAHQIFFSPKAIYLLVWKPRSGVDPELHARLERIQLSAGETAKVLIVSTHADENIPAVIGKDAIRERFGDFVWGFFSIDSATGPNGTGIADLRLEIARAAAQLEGIDTPFPLTWHNAHKEVRSLATKPTITFGEFEDICLKHEVSVENAESLAAVMDVQGNAVYFAEAPQDAGVARGENLVVLDPEWLAKAVTFVIEDDRTRADSGVLLHKRLGEIWKRRSGHRSCPGYRPNLHGYLLWLMWKFDIAYRQNEHTSLVPELIDRNRPDDLRWTPAVPPQEPQLRLICRIQQNPPVGLIPVLTAAAHPLRRIQNPEEGADQLDRNWRDGFFIDTALRGTGLVELVDRDLWIIVRDRYPSDLARQVRKTLQRITEARWPRLKTDYRVPCIGQCEESSCPGTFRLDYLEPRRGKKVSCQHCGNDELEVDKMLEGFDANAEKVLHELRELKAGQVELMTVALRIYRDALDPVRSEFERAPCMFTILPEGGGWNLAQKLAENRVRVTCWCEHPDGPHPASPIGSDEPPDYILKAPKAWLVKAAPYISWAATLLKAFVPLAGAVVKQGLDDVLPKNLKDEIDLMSDASKALPSGSLELDPEFRLDGMNQWRPEIVALRHIHDALLAQVNENKRWGDLRPVRTKTGDLLWLCAKHAAIQQPPVQQIS